MLETVGHPDTALTSVFEGDLLTCSSGSAWLLKISFLKIHRHTGTILKIEKL